jgi:hypothetical protein
MNNNLNLQKIRTSEERYNERMASINVSTSSQQYPSTQPVVQPQPVDQKKDDHQKNGTNGDAKPDEDVVTKFKDLSYTDVQINLRFLGDLKEGERVRIIDEKYMQVDQRYVQSVQRYFSSDSRQSTLNFIEHLINWAKKYCNDAVEKIRNNEDRQNNLEKLINLQALLNSAKTGLSRMASTYMGDKHNLATIETFKNTIQTFCDQDLKKAITSK